MTADEYEHKLAELRSDVSELVQRLQDELGARDEIEAYPEDFIDWPADALDDHLAANPCGWVLTVELFNPMESRTSGFARTLAAPMQSPAQSIGILRMGLDNYRPG